MHVTMRLSDVSATVRESVVELVGQYMVLQYVRSRRTWKPLCVSECVWQAV